MRGRMERMWQQIARRHYMFDYSPEFPRLTKKELFLFLVNSADFVFEFNRWKEHGFTRDSMPVVDRIDNEKGYSLGNIQVINQGFNGSKGNKKDKKYIIKQRKLVHI